MADNNGKHVRFSAARAALLGLSVVALSACGDGNGLNLDLDLRPKGLGTSDAARQAATDRPAPDARGVITYPNFQVAVARRGDTLSKLADRVGADPAALARHNGIELETKLRRGEVVALPETLRGTNKRQAAPGSVDITALAGNALDRADDAGGGTQTAGLIAPAAVQSGPEPVQHQVVRGETAFSIARLYNVSVRSLSDWNGLGSDLEVREGQYLLIPVAQSPEPGASTSAAPSPEPQPEDTPVVVAPLPVPEPVQTTTVPGQGSVAPEPPSASTPLPEPEDAPPAVVAQPAPAAAPTPPVADLGQDRTAASATRFSMPVQGAIIRDYQKGSNDGIGIAASAGTPVKAAASGTVAAITLDTDGVPILVLRHSGNVLTVYANIDDVQLKKGDSVSPGQTVAKVRDDGQGFLHFEVREGFDSVDPITYLN